MDCKAHKQTCVANHKVENLSKGTQAENPSKGTQTEKYLVIPFVTPLTDI